MTVGKPRRVSMRDSMTNSVCNNFSIKLPGLFPAATGFYIPANQGNSKKYFPGVNYPFTSSCNPADWKYYKAPRGPGGLLWNNRIVTQVTVVNGLPNLL